MKYAKNKAAVSAADFARVLPEKVSGTEKEVNEGRYHVCILSAREGEKR